MRIADWAGDAAAGRHGDGKIHETEGRPRPGIACKNIDAVRDSVLRSLHLNDEALSRLTTPCRKPGEFVALGTDPTSIENGQINQSRFEFNAVPLSHLSQALTPDRTSLLK